MKLTIKKHPNPAYSFCSAIKLANKNIDKAHNFDLEGLSQMLDSYVDDLNEIKKFEIYSFDDEE